MSNSSLATYRKISPNRNSPRNHAIDRITIHHMAWVQATAKVCGESFAKSSRQASSNYGIGYDGDIALYVEEKDRSWCSSSAENDNRAVTIEVANSKGAPNWEVSNKSYKALIALVTDICKRNGKTKIIWFGNKDKTLKYKPANNEMIMTVHRWFSSTTCPGPYLYDHMDDIANAVNTNLQKVEPVKEEKKEEKYYQIQIGAFKDKSNAEKRAKYLKDIGISSAFIFIDDSSLYKVRTPATKIKSEAEFMLAKIKNAGFTDAFII